jgi:hypothetical protein
MQSNVFGRDLWGVLLSISDSRSVSRVAQVCRQLAVLGAAELFRRIECRLLRRCKQHHLLCLKLWHLECCRPDCPGLYDSLPIRCRYEGCLKRWCCEDCREAQKSCDSCHWCMYWNTGVEDAVFHRPSPELWRWKENTKNKQLYWAAT